MNRNIHLRRYVARAAAVLVMAGVAAGTVTATAHARTQECVGAMDHVDWALSNYEGAINSGNRSEIRYWQSVSRSAIDGADAACG
jgi:hypothetical protein